MVYRKIGKSVFHTPVFVPRPSVFGHFEPSQCAKLKLLFFQTVEFCFPQPLSLVYLLAFSYTHCAALLWKRERASGFMSGQLSAKRCWLAVVDVKDAQRMGPSWAGYCFGRCVFPGTWGHWESHHCGQLWTRRLDQTKQNKRKEKRDEPGTRVFPRNHFHGIKIQIEWIIVISVFAFCFASSRGSVSFFFRGCFSSKMKDA